MPIRRLFMVAVVTVTALTALVAGPAEAAHPGTSRISARASDYTPAAGEVFAVRGLYTPGGLVVAGQVVRLQSYAAGKWTNIAGARVTTNADGRYRMRVILSVRGVRDLRVMGIAADGHGRSFQRFTVQVH
jgi:hypothetical protein